MIELFNELLQCIRLIIDTLFNRLEFIPGLGYGWIWLAITALDLAIYYLFGRMNE